MPVLRLLQQQEDGVVDQVLDAGIVGDRKVQILTDTTVTFKGVDDKVRQNVVLVDVRIF